MASRGCNAIGIVTLLALMTACADDRDRTAIAESSLPAPPVEEGIRVAVPSHCGVLGVRVEGELWLAHPRLGDHNPPPGWDENETTGVLLRTGPGRAVFTGDGGQRATFERAPRGAPDPNAGCE
ncbi:hypothetical protein [Nocardioides pacificus]